MRRVALLIVWMFACNLPACASDRKPPRRIRAFLGAQAVSVLSEPQRVEVYRVAPKFPASGAEPPTTNSAHRTIGDYLVIDEAPVQDAAFGRELARILFSRDAYWFEGAKACVFFPDTLLRVHGSRGHVDVVTCFSCNEFRLTSYDSSGQVAKSVAEDFDGVRDRLAALVEGATGVAPAGD